MSIKDEKLGELLDRILVESDVYINWFEIVQYFTKRGFPV